MIDYQHISQIEPKLNEKEHCTTSFGADLLRSEKLRSLKGKDGVALLDDVQVIVVVAEGAMKAVIVHFCEDDLRRQQRCSGEAKYC